MIKPLKLGDKVEFIKDIDLPNYPETATSLIRISKQMIGKTYRIVAMRTHDLNHKPTKYRYGIYAPLLTYCTREELKLV